MTIAIRRITFCAGHRLFHHEGRCAHLHGHNYVVHFHARADRLDAVGRVIDFGALRDALGGWIGEHWDHGFIVFAGDREARAALSAIPGQRLYVLDVNPTAENLAAHLLHVVGPKVLAGTGVRLVRVELWETENCCAAVALEGQDG